MLKHDHINWALHGEETIRPELWLLKSPEIETIQSYISYTCNKVTRPLG